MSALDQGLLLAPAAVPPPPAPPQVTSPAAPPSKAGGALGQALGIVQAARQAAAADPLQTAATDAAKTDQAAREEAAAKIQAGMAQVQALQAQPDAPRPSVPRLKPLPSAPEVQHKDPMRVFGQLLPVIAALGALTTKAPAINALNAATAMIAAGKANDKEEEAKQRQAWIDNLNLTVQNNTSLLNDYKLALDDHNATVTERMAKINAIAAQNRDYVTLAALKGGNLDSLTKFIQLQSTATGQLATLTTTLQDQQLRRENEQNQQLMQLAHLEIARRAELRQEGQVSMGDSIGPVLVKIQQADPKLAAQGLDKVLSAGEIQALKLYMDINRQAAFNNQPGSGAAAGAGGIAGLVAPPAAAPAAPQAEYAHPVTAAAPPVSPVTAAPQNPKDRLVNKVYGTPRGPMTWTTRGWIPAPGG